MTNKQIIIDGVDVSGCENYIGANTKTHNCTLYDGYLRPCKNADCYYKQLKAKEQECEELKNERTVDLVKQLDQLKAENDELKMKNRILETECNEMRDVCDEFEQYYEHLMEGLNKLKQTLAEIKEIAEFGFRPYKVCGEHNNCCDVLNEIWNKISECEVGDE